MTRESGDHYAVFLRITGEESPYRYCTLTEKLQVYVAHRPGSVVPFLEELIRQLHPEWNDDKHEDRQPD